MPLHKEDKTHPQNPSFKPHVTQVIKTSQGRQDKRQKFYHVKLAEFPAKKTYILTAQEYLTFPHDEEF